jgi:hypothetical protein
MKRNIIFSSLIILFSRILDLFTTYLSTTDFYNQETNFLVKLFNINFKEFIILDIILAFLLIILHVYSTNKYHYFNIISESFNKYFVYFFYSKNNITFEDFLFKIKIKKSMILFGLILPKYVLYSSLIFCLNNLWVYFYINNNKIAIKGYDFFNKFHFFDFIIYVLPITILVYLIYNRLKQFYLYYNLY